MDDKTASDLAARATTAALQNQRNAFADRAASLEAANAVLSAKLGEVGAKCDALDKRATDLESTLAGLNAQHEADKAAAAAGAAQPQAVAPQPVVAQASAEVSAA